MTLDDARREMISHHESLIERAAERMTAATGIPIEQARLLSRDRIMAALPRETKVFLATGRLPRSAFPD